jgi:hypothetical protein
MRLPLRGVSALVLIGLTSYAQAQDGMPNSANSLAAETHRPALTGKERLGRKWTDEQRIDNCHVPIDKRGSKPRPSVPVLTFVPYRGGHFYECQNQRDTSKHMILVWL